MIYEFPWYGIQGEGGYYGDGQDRVFPGIDLVEVSNARSVVLWHAAFPLLADNVTDIEDHVYTHLFCDGIETSGKKLHVAQQYILDNGYNNFKAIIKVRTEQSDAEIDQDLCDGDPETPAWSHVCGTSWGSDHYVSATPNDIPDNLPGCCRNTPTPLFAPPPHFNSTYSPNLFDYSATLANGCTGIFGNNNYNFENECDMKWAGLDITGCVEDGPYKKNETGLYWFLNLNEADEYGHHLAHHYMQAYFSFVDGLTESTSACYGYPFGISSLNLGLLMGRWLAGTGADTDSVETAMQFSNMYFAEVRSIVLKGHVGMEHAYYYGSDSVPWPVTNPEDRDRWRRDFGYLGDPLTNKLAVFRIAFLETIFDYIKKDITDDTRYFDGLLIHYYSHWSCIETTIEYLNALRLKLKSEAPDTDLLPVVINELGNRRRLDSYDPDLDCYKCDKTLEYETGWSRNRVSPPPNLNDELPHTQAAAAARKLIRFSAPNLDGTGNNIRGIMWEWMMKPKDHPTDKCEIVQGCGRKPMLPGYRFTAFDAYKFFVYLINRVMYLPDYVTIAPLPPSDQDDLTHVYKLVMRRDHPNTKHVTAYWSYNWDIMYSEGNSGRETPITPPGAYTEAHLYNAVGEYLGQYYSGSFDFPISTSPQYISWGEQLTGWSEDTVDNYSQVAFIPNKSQGSDTDPIAVIYEFDSENEKRLEITGEFSGYTDLRGLAWTGLDGRLLVSCNTTDAQPRILTFHSLTGGYAAEKDIILRELDSENREVFGIATDVKPYNGKDTDWLYALVRKSTGEYCMDVYRYSEGWVNDSSIEITGLSQGETPQQIRTSMYWSESDPEDKKFIETLFISTGYRIFYLNQDLGQPAFNEFTLSDPSCSCNGFGFAHDGDLYVSVSDAGADNRILKYEIDWSAGPPFDTPAEIISLGNDKPMGFRITPFGTLGISIDVHQGGSKVVEYANDAAGDFSMPRLIVEYSAGGLTVGDLEYSYNR